MRLTYCCPLPCGAAGELAASGAAAPGSPLSLASRVALPPGWAEFAAEVLEEEEEEEEARAAAAAARRREQRQELAALQEQHAEQARVIARAQQRQSELQEEMLQLQCMLLRGAPRASEGGE